MLWLWVTLSWEGEVGKQQCFPADLDALLFSGLTRFGCAVRTEYRSYGNTFGTNEDARRKFFKSMNIDI